MIGNWLEPKIPPSARALDRNFSGFVFISDIDKTYLATQIDSIGGLLAAAFETAERKISIPGFSFVLRGVRRGAQDESQNNPLFFLSASPPQIQTKIQAKMEIDKISHDGIIFKDQIVHVRQANFHKLREQLGYKIFALLRLWRDLPKKSKLVFFGDDSESDPLVFSIFAEILAKTLEGRDLAELLQQLKVSRDDALAIGWESRKIQDPQYPVYAAFLNLESGSRADYYLRYGEFLIPTENSLQIAVVLFEMGLIRVQAIKSVLKELIIFSDGAVESIERSIIRAGKRKIFLVKTLATLAPVLSEFGFSFERIQKGIEGDLPKSEAVESTSVYLKPHVPIKKDLAALKFRYSDEGRY